MTQIKNHSVQHQELLSLELFPFATMKDINTNIPFDEASFYFCDPAFEKPLRRVSWNTVMGVRSIERVPSKITLMDRVEPNTALEMRSEEFRWKDSIQEMDPDCWMHDSAGADESTCGTLDYSIDTMEEKKSMLNSERTLVTRGDDDDDGERQPLQTTIVIPVESQVMVEDDKMNQDIMYILDVHSKKKGPECFGIPMGWLGDLISNLAE